MPYLFQIKVLGNWWVSFASFILTLRLHSSSFWRSSKFCIVSPLLSFRHILAERVACAYFDFFCKRSSVFAGKCCRKTHDVDDGVPCHFLFSLSLSFSTVGLVIHYKRDFWKRGHAGKYTYWAQNVLFFRRVFEWNAVDAGARVHCFSWQWPCGYGEPMSPRIFSRWIRNAPLALITLLAFAFHLSCTASNSSIALINKSHPGILFCSLFWISTSIDVLIQWVIPGSFCLENGQLSVAVVHKPTLVEITNTLSSKRHYFQFCWSVQETQIVYHFDFGKLVQTGWS